MAVKVFQPSQYKEEIKQLLRDGTPIDEITGKYPLSERTLFRYQNEVEEEKKGQTQTVKKTGTNPVGAGAGVSKDSFTATGTPFINQSGQEFVYVGPIRMPVMDFGYSSARNLFIVADTYEQAKSEFKFPPNLKVGDFCAELCQAFRMMMGMDVIGGGAYPVRIEAEMEGQGDGTATESGPAGKTDTTVSADSEKRGGGDVKAGGRNSPGSGEQRRRGTNRRGNTAKAGKP